MHYNISGVTPSEHISASQNHFSKSESGTFSEALDLLLIIKLILFLHQKMCINNSKTF